MVENMTMVNPVAAAESPSEQEDNMSVAAGEWFLDHMARQTDINPETLWKVITLSIPPNLMNTYIQFSLDCFQQLWPETFSLVQCYLSILYYLILFLHIPTFLTVSHGFLLW